VLWVCGEKRTAVQLSYSIHCLRRGSAYLPPASRVSRSAVLIRRFITSVIFAFSNALIVRRLVHQAVKSPFGTRSGFHSILPWRVHPTCTLRRLPPRPPPAPHRSRGRAEATPAGSLV